MKYKAKIFYNQVEEVELEADSYEEARTKAYDLGGTGKTTTHFDFIEVEEAV